MLVALIKNGGTDIIEDVAKGVGKKAYLAIVIDLYDRFPVGYAISDRGFQFTR